MTFTGFLLQFMLLVAIAAVLAIPKPRGGFFSILLVSLALGSVTEFYGLITASMGIPNLLVYNVYSCIEVVLICWLVYKACPQYRNYVIAALVLIILTFCYSVFLNGGFAGEFLLEGMLISSLMFVVLSLLVLFVLAQTSSEVLYKHPYFWIFLGILAYFGGFVPVVGSSKYLSEMDKGLAKTLYPLVTLLAAVRYLFAGIAAYFEIQRRKALDS